LPAVKMYSLPPIVIDFRTNWGGSLHRPICHFMRHLSFLHECRSCGNQRYELIILPGLSAIQTGTVASKTCPPVPDLAIAPDPGMHNKSEKTTANFGYNAAFRLILFKYFFPIKNGRSGPICRLIAPATEDAVLLQRSADHFWQSLNVELWGGCNGVLAVVVSFSAIRSSHLPSALPRRVAAEFGTRGRGVDDGQGALARGKNSRRMDRGKRLFSSDQQQGAPGFCGIREHFYSIRKPRWRTGLFVSPTGGHAGQRSRARFSSISRIKTADSIIQEFHLKILPRLRPGRGRLGIDYRWLNPGHKDDRKINNSPYRSGWTSIYVGRSAPSL